MKKQLFLLTAVIVFMTALSTNNVFAQEGRAKIDFDFNIGQRSYPAGVYQVDKSPLNLGFFAFRSLSKNAGQGFALPIALISRREQSPKLIFTVINGNYYLTEMYFSKGKAGYSFPLPKKKNIKHFLSTATTVEYPLNSPLTANFD